MLTQSELVFGLGLPALVGAVLFLLAAAPAGAERSVGRDASPFALALGYVIAEIALVGPPAIPPPEARQSIFFALVALVVLSAAYQCFAAGAWRYDQPIAIALVLLPTIWVMARPLAENAWSKTETIAWLSGVGLAAAAMTLALARLLRRRPGPVASAGLVMTLTAATLVLLMSGTKTYAQLAGAAAAALLPGLVLGLGKRTSPFSEHLAAAFVLVLGGLVIAGHWYASLTPLDTLLLFVAPLGLWFGELPVLNRWPGCRRGLVALAAVALPLALAIGLAARKFVEDTAGGY